ncbi:hypothetical protein [Streptomyces sp. SPB074]|uniref:hypothetical protein n=1 Tax=Streptomyces sp. (strain SPB074) TaxID=465543 RepID=UPI00017F25EE|nr:hypothetical protein [Streptomyces sp. SPB074]
MSLTPYDEISIRHAREILGRADLVDLTDPMAAARAIGELKVAVRSLLAILTPQHSDEEATR